MRPPPRNHNQDRQPIPHGIHNQIGPVEVAAGHEQLVALVEQRARKADGKRCASSPRETRAQHAARRHGHEQAQHPELHDVRPAADADAEKLAGLRVVHAWEGAEQPRQQVAHGIGLSARDLRRQCGQNEDRDGRRKREGGGNARTGLLGMRGLWSRGMLRLLRQCLDFTEWVGMSLGKR